MAPAVLGAAGVWLAFLGALAGMVVCAVSLARTRAPVPADDVPTTRVASRLDARLLVAVVLGGAAVAVAAMEFALITHDFHLVYVADDNAKATPLVYSITGLWSALAGSILLWGMVLAVFTGLVVWRYRHKVRDTVVRWALLVMYAVTAFFFGLMVGPANPFHTTGTAPLHGAGPNALLQDNPLVAIHPPLLYIGFVGFTVPFAFAIGMLATGRVGELWQSEVRRWTLFAWTALSVGIVLGAWWSYQVLGWGGFWGWDPVENAALMPWLCGTAYLHSVLVQERRGLLRVWNLSLSVATFALTILGTFLTRSGVIFSVHAFTESGDIGPILIGFFLLVVVAGFGLIAWRGDRLRSSVGIDAPLGREGAFVVNNLVFVGFAFIVLLGTLFPLLYQLLKNQAVTVGAPYFDTVAVPVGLALLLLMAVAPALSWRKVDAHVLWSRLVVPAWAGVLVVVACVAAGVRGFEPLVAFGLATFAAASALRSIALAVRASVRHGSGWWRGLVGRTNGGMVVHLGVVLLAVGLVAATSFRSQSELVLRQGRPVTFAGHTFTFERLRSVHTPQRIATEAVVRVDGTPFMPAVSQYDGPSSEAVGTPAIDSGFFGDVYLTWDATGHTGKSTGGNIVPTLPRTAIALGVVVQPLIAWMWAGGLLVGIGGLLALVPGQRRRATDPVSALAPIAAGAPPEEKGALAGSEVAR